MDNFILNKIKILSVYWNSDVNWKTIFTSDKHVKIVFYSGNNKEIDYYSI